MSNEDEKSSKLMQLLDEWNLVHERVEEFALLAICWRVFKQVLKIEEADDKNK